MQDGPADGPATATYSLARYPEQVVVVRLGPGAELPGLGGVLLGLLDHGRPPPRPRSSAPRAACRRRPRQAGPFTAFEVAGPLDLALTGVLSALLAPLAEAGISVFTLSTFDTDWMLVPKERADDAAEEWRRHGHTVAPAVPA